MRWICGNPVFCLFSSFIFGPYSSVCLHCWCSSDLYYVPDVFKTLYHKCNSLDNCLQVICFKLPKLCYLWLYVPSSSLVFLMISNFSLNWTLTVLYYLSSRLSGLSLSIIFRHIYMRTKEQASVDSNTCAIHLVWFASILSYESSLNFTVFFFSSASLFFISQLRETQSKLKQESTLQYNDEEAQLQMRFRRIMVSSVMLTNEPNIT